MKIELLLSVLFFISCAGLKDKVQKLDLSFAPPKKSKKFNVAWIKNLDPKEQQTGNLPIGTGSPLIYESIVYMGSLDGAMSAYDLNTGRLLWRHLENQPINTQPSVFQDLIIYGSQEGRLFARNYITGKLVYAIDLGAPIESSGKVFAGRYFVHLRDHRIVALDVATGKIFWNYKRSVPLVTTLQRVSRIYPFDNKLIVGFADGYLVALSMEEGIVIWEQKLATKLKFIDVDVDPIYFAGSLVAGSAGGELKFINPKNGMITRSFPITMGHTPVIMKDKLIVGSVYGELFTVNSQGKILKKTQLSDVGISSIKKWKNGLVVSTVGKELYFLDIQEHEILDRYNLGHDQSAVFGHLQVEKNHLALYSSRNRLYVFK